MKSVLAITVALIAGVSASINDGAHGLLREIPCQYLYNGAWYNLMTPSSRYYTAQMPKIVGGDNRYI